jgi:hypothetical protein
VRLVGVAPKTIPTPSVPGDDRYRRSAGALAGGSLERALLRRAGLEPAGGVQGEGGDEDGADHERGHGESGNHHDFGASADGACRLDLPASPAKQVVAHERSGPLRTSSCPESLG